VRGDFGDASTSIPRREHGPHQLRGKSIMPGRSGTRRSDLAQGSAREHGEVTLWKCPIDGTDMVQQRTHGQRVGRIVNVLASKGLDSFIDLLE
jgi:hypothetical protein